MNNTFMIRRFEEISNNAWPALQTMLYDGWILRFAGGVTKRSNSVSLLYPSNIDPDEKITFCETLYRKSNITPCFKITSISAPEDIDSRLSARGYFIHSHISFQALEIKGYTASPSSGITIENDLNPSWMDHFIRMNGFDKSRKPVYLGIMNHILTPKCLVSIHLDNQVAAVGLGVLEGRYVGIFDLVVDPCFRRQGLALKIMNTILFWGAQSGAETAYLQVLADNLPALALYKKIGFLEAYRYWYRMNQ